MHADSFVVYVEAAIRGYAEDNIAAGRWPTVGAVERSRAEFEASLPQGLNTPDNYLFEILDDENGPTVGYAWYALQRKHGSCGAYIYDLEVKPEHRRKGHAYRALKAMEPLAVKAGATSIGLNVFASNVGAQALYRRLGYAPTNFNMYKALPDVSRP
ncbi:MAG: GNAT family N-acetyltransferase [Gammaproteobacteria bacterium]|nr:GNAT family N-acetyltransferase [Gammaproteobacteria bacterium]